MAMPVIMVPVRGEMIEKIADDSLLNKRELPHTQTYTHIHIQIGRQTDFLSNTDLCVCVCGEVDT